MAHAEFQRNISLSWQKMHVVKSRRAKHRRRTTTALLKRAPRNDKSVSVVLLSSTLIKMLIKTRALSCLGLAVETS